MKQAEIRENQNGKKCRGILRLLIFCALILLIVLLNRRFGWSSWLSDLTQLSGLSERIETNLPAMFLIYCALTVFACVFLALPGITFAVLAGMLFGPWLGTLACLLACTLGAMIAFLAGRFFLKDAVGPMLEKNRLLRKLLFSGNRRNDILVLMITRLVPLFPYNLQNFAYGVTDISFATYSLCTFLFMLPGVALYTVGAAGFRAGADAWKYFLFAGVLLIFVLLLGAWIKKRYLGEELSE